MRLSGFSSLIVLPLLLKWVLPTTCDFQPAIDQSLFLQYKFGYTDIGKYQAYQTHVTASGLYNVVGAQDSTNTAVFHVILRKDSFDNKTSFTVHHKLSALKDGLGVRENEWVSLLVYDSSTTQPSLIIYDISDTANVAIHHR